MAFILAGIMVGFVLGFLGAGGTVVGLPFLLLFTSLEGHPALGTNASGVALISLAILGWRLFQREVRILEGVVFTLPGLIGIFAGVRLGLIFPGKQLVFLLGFVLFLIAGWMFYLSAQKPDPIRPEEASTGERPSGKRLGLLGLSAFLVGATAGFFAIGGGFMIVPALILAGGLSLEEAAATALLPIALFSSLVAAAYWQAGEVEFVFSMMMFVPGLVGGMSGLWLAHRLPKQILQRAFAVLLVFIGVYFIAF